MITHQAKGFTGDDVYHLLVSQGVQIATSGFEYRQGIISRLDIGTSGVLVVAKNEQSYQNLKRQFATHSVRKVYYALAQGHITEPSGRINAPIGRHPNPKKRSLQAVVDNGKEAVTDFDVLTSYTDIKGATYSLLKVILHTGRTHQIRVHLSSYGHPLVGDPLYNGLNKSENSVFIDLTRPFLHSGSLTLEHPETKTKMTFNAPFPKDLRQVLLKLNKK